MPRASRAGPCHYRRRTCSSSGSPTARRSSDEKASIMMRPVTVAAVQVAPSAAQLTPAVIEANTARALKLVEACVAATGAELVVLPESVTTGFTTGTDPLALWDLVSEIPGTVLEPFVHAAKELGIYLVAGSYERGSKRGVVHNAAVIAGPAGDVLGV